MKSKEIKRNQKKSKEIKRNQKKSKQNQKKSKEIKRNQKKSKENQKKIKRNQKYEIMRDSRRVDLISEYGAPLPGGILLLRRC